jgi:hypothetical protein
MGEAVSFGALMLQNLVVGWPCQNAWQMGIFSDFVTEP